MSNSLDRNARNDKIMDIILESAAELYAREIAEAPAVCPVSEAEEKTMAEQEAAVYKSVMGQVRKAQKPGRKRLKKCLLCAAVLAALAGLAVSVSALRVFLYKTYAELNGAVLNIKTSRVTEDDYNGIQKFQRREAVVVPGWLPPDLPLVQVQDDDTGISLEYQNEDTWLTIEETAFSPGGAEVHVAAENNAVKVEEIRVLDTEGVLTEIRSELGTRVFMADWSTDKVRYELSTNSARIVLDTVLQNLKYLSSAP